jgi:hypothetical protein
MFYDRFTEIQAVRDEIANLRADILNTDDKPLRRSLQAALDDAIDYVEYLESKEETS